MFGCYVQSLVAAARGIEHVQAAALEYRRVGERAVVVLDDGSELMADRVVLATWKTSIRRRCAGWMGRRLPAARIAIMRGATRPTRGWIRMRRWR